MENNTKLNVVDDELYEIQFEQDINEYDDDSFVAEVFDREDLFSDNETEPEEPELPTRDADKSEQIQTSTSGAHTLPGYNNVYAEELMNGDIFLFPNQSDESEKYHFSKVNDQWEHYAENPKVFLNESQLNYVRYILDDSDYYELDFDADHNLVGSTSDCDDISFVEVDFDIEDPTDYETETAVQELPTRDAVGSEQIKTSTSGAHILPGYNNVYAEELMNGDIFLYPYQSDESEKYHFSKVNDQWEHYAENPKVFLKESQLDYVRYILDDSDYYEEDFDADDNMIE